MNLTNLQKESRMRHRKAYSPRPRFRARVIGIECYENQLPAISSQPYKTHTVVINPQEHSIANWIARKEREAVK